MENDESVAFALNFSDIDLDDIHRVGGKNASLGEMNRSLTADGVRIPPGFAVTAAGYRFFLEANQLGGVISGELSELDKDLDGLHRRGENVRRAILDADFPDELADAIVEAYRRLEDREQTSVAVRSSATAEDLPEASFAGQQESYLNVVGSDELLWACQKCYASLFTDRAISYRSHRGFSHTDLALSVGVQKMVRADLGAAGVAFSIDTETGFEDAVLINGAWGLGESVVKGTVNPDEFYVYKPKLHQGYRPIIGRQLGDKSEKVVCESEENSTTKTVDAGREQRQQFCLTDDQVLELARWVCLIEDHYTQRAGQPRPMDVEWALDGETGDLYVVQARPETVQSRRHQDVFKSYSLRERSKVLVQGRSIGEGIAAGEIQNIESPSHIQAFEDGNILVTDTTDPDWEPIMKRASAIITNRGGRTSHAAIVSRELGLPAVVGTGDATSRLEDGQSVTVSCAEGETGNVYEGILQFDVDTIEVNSSIELETDIMVNLADPGLAFRHAKLPVSGVGLAREEFVVANRIGVHPMALVAPEKLDKETREEIEKRTARFENKGDLFVEQLSEAIGMIAAAFDPENVIVRLSDFKTNEYASLLGGEFFEADEANPMLGFRGASRYYSDEYRDAFELECRALKRVRTEMGLKNLKIMIPFCRTLEEARKVQELMAENGLVRGEDGLELYVMCELPSNVVLADEFAEYFDGFSIGSNDLTQLSLGVDRDSERLAHLFDERNEAVKEMIRMVIRKAKGNDCRVGICGQAPSDYPEFAEFLVEEGIDSISLTPDTVMKTIKRLGDSGDSGDSR